MTDSVTLPVARHRPRLPRRQRDRVRRGPPGCEGSFSLTLPGEKKLQTPVRLDVGEHALGVHAFVCRNPDENHARVYRWLLERNLRMYAVAFAVDHSGDIYLDARLPLSAVSDDELDRLLGSVLAHADESFNAILELGFATSIRKEWEWRLSRGESTSNLEAFRGWLEAGDRGGDRGRRGGREAMTTRSPEVTHAGTRDALDARSDALLALPKLLALAHVAPGPPPAHAVLARAADEAVIADAAPSDGVVARAAVDRGPCTCRTAAWSTSRGRGTWSQRRDRLGPSCP